MKTGLRRFKETLKSFLENPSNFSLSVGPGRCRALSRRSCEMFLKSILSKILSQCLFVLSAPMAEAKPRLRRRHEKF